MKEIWNDIEGYEGFYQVSNLGRVKSIKRKARYYNHSKELFRMVNEKIIYQRETNWGYYTVNLNKNGQTKIKRIHRLVASAFIPNPEHKEEVNHKDSNKKNNRVNNLEWATRSENAIHAWENNLLERNRIAIKKNIIKAYTACKKQIDQYDKDGNFIKTWDSISDASRNLNIHHSDISRCCSKKRKTAGGYIWKSHL